MTITIDCYCHPLTENDTTLTVGVHDYQQASVLPRICTRVCASLVVIVSLRIALGSLKEEER